MITELVPIIWALFYASHATIPTQSFYPYGLSHGDSALPKTDEDYSTIDIAFGFPFFRTAYRQIHISPNGIINLGQGNRSSTPQSSSIQEFKCIAAFWTDSDPSAGGDIYYRETTVATLLSRLSYEINSKFIGLQSFAGKWAAILTFDRVAQFGCVSGGVGGGGVSCSRNCSDTLTYQVILTSDGINSFIMFLYNDLSFTSGTKNCNTHAQIGYSAGDGSVYYLVPSSNTEDIASKALTQSNVGVPGQWIFTVDGSNIPKGCNTHGMLDIHPRKTLYFGREDLTLTGPCFSESTGDLSVTFGSQQVSCQIKNSIQLHCTAPYFARTGLIDVKLTYRGTQYATFLVIADLNDGLVLHSDHLFRNVEDLDASFEIIWNASALKSNENTIELRGYQVDFTIGGDNDVASESVVPLNLGTLSNSGRFTLRPVSNPNAGPRIIRRLNLLIYASKENRLHQIARVVTLASSTASEQQCRSWYNKQPAEEALRLIVEQESVRSPCSPAIPTDFPTLFENFQLDGSCNPSQPFQCLIFHAGAKGCYRSIDSPGRKVVQCCYDSSGRLILGPPGGGHLHFADTQQSLWEHLRQDVIPYSTCCKLSTLCSLYYEKRPSIESRQFGLSGWGSSGGDPHFVTVDGTEYTFNPVGEFDYALTETDTIQVRISQFIDENNSPKQASYFSAFVAKCDSSDIVQIELNEVDQYRFRVNGEGVFLNFGTWSFNGISLNYFNRTLASLRTYSGLGAEFRINGGVLNVILSLPHTAKGKVRGLIGDWDGSRDNDFQLRNGQRLSPNPSPVQIHREFGMSWATTKATSLFTYPTGLAWNDYQDEGFIPLYSLLPPQNPECNGNTLCNYDAYATGNACVGLTNIARIAEAEKHALTSGQLSLYCPKTVTVNNGNVEVEEISQSHVTYTVSCNRGFRVDGNARVTCQNGKYDQLPVCTADSDVSKSSSAYPISAHLLLIAAALVIIINKS